MSVQIRPSIQSVTVQQNGSSVILETVTNNVIVQTGIAGPASAGGGAGGPVSWDDIEGKPETFPAGGGAGGVLSGTFPNPGFAVNMATQAELDDAIATRAPASHTHAQSEVTGLVSVLAAKADLVGGKVPTSQLPSIALVEFLGAVANQSAMLALVGQPGDFCFRTDQGLAYFLVSGTGSSLANWQAVTTPGSIGVASVNGQVGAVVLGKADIGLALVNNTSDMDKPVSTAQLAALNGKASLTGGSSAIAEQVELTSSNIYDGMFLPGGYHLDLADTAGTVGVWWSDGSNSQPGAALDRWIAVGVVAEDTAEDIVTKTAAALTDDGAFTATANTTSLKINYTVNQAGATVGPTAGNTGFGVVVVTGGADEVVPSIAPYDGSLLTGVIPAAHTHEISEVNGLESALANRSPAGSTGALQFNAGGSFGAVSGVTLSGSTLTAVTATQSALGATSAAGVLLVNSTAATNGSQQVSPALRLRGNGFKTDATSASRTVEFGQHVLPIQGAANPTGALLFTVSVNGAAHSEVARIDSNQQLSFGTGANGCMTGALGAAGLLIGRFDQANPAALAGYACYVGNYNGNTVTLPSDGVFGLSSGSGSLWATRDSGIARSAAAVVAICDGTTTGAGALELREMTAPSAPSANRVRLYAEDNGSGKTRIMARFNTGAAVQIAIEP